MLYDIEENFSDNFSIHIPIDSPIPPPPILSITNLNKRIRSPIGVAAPSATVGSKIIELAKLGFGVVTYKSIRAKALAFAGHLLPNLTFIQSNASWPFGLLPEQCIASAILPKDLTKLSVVNSIANASLAKEVMHADIQKSKRVFSRKQVLAASIYGEGDTPKARADDLAGVSGYAIFKLAKEFIKRAVEINIQQKFDFAILAAGGVTQGNDCNHFLEIGPDIAMSATAVLWNPYIANEFLKGKIK